MIHKFLYFFILSFSTMVLGKEIFVQFDIYDLKTKKLFYKGEETISYRDNKVHKKTQYFDNKKKLAQLEIFSCYLDSFKTILYSFDNYENGEKLKLVNENDSFSILHKKNFKQKAVKKPIIKWKQNQIVGKALHEVITKNWGALLSEKDVNFNILVPSRAEEFQFQLVRRKNLEKKKKRYCYNA